MWVRTTSDAEPTIFKVLPRFAGISAELSIVRAYPYTAMPMPSLIDLIISIDLLISIELMDLSGNRCYANAAEDIPSEP